MSETEQAKDETLDILEETSDVIEETLDHIESFDPPSKAGAVLMGVIGLAVGATAGYFITKKFMASKYEAIVKQEIEEAREFYKRLNKVEGFDSPIKAIEELRKNDPEDDTVSNAAKALRNYQGAQDEEEPEEDVEEASEEVEEGMDEESVNIFTHDQVDPDFDLEAEMETRSSEAPYVISQEEFLQGEENFEQTAITYYEGDDTLADERDQEIPYPDPIVGSANLQRFGHGSGDERVVYVRNEKLSTDFEILKSDGKFSHEVLGLQHSEESARDRQRRNRPSKFRGQDE